MWGTRYFLIYSCVGAKKGHVRPVKGLLIPLSFLSLASYPVYTFSSSHSGVVDLKAQPSALRWNCQLYDIIVYVYKCTSKADEFIRTVGFALWVYQIFRITYISIFLEICVNEKMCENKCNVVQILNFFFKKYTIK